MHSSFDATHKAFVNNSFPPKISQSRLELYKSNYRGKNLMAEMIAEAREEKDETEGSEKAVPLTPSELEEPVNDNTAEEAPAKNDGFYSKTIRRIIEQYGE